MSKLTLESLDKRLTAIEARLAPADDPLGPVNLNDEVPDKLPQPVASTSASQDKRWPVESTYGSTCHYCGKLWIMPTSDTTGCCDQQRAAHGYGTHPSVAKQPVADDAQVICPGCSHQFPAISVKHQQEIAALKAQLAEIERDRDSWKEQHKGMVKCEDIVFRNAEKLRNDIAAIRAELESTKAQLADAKREYSVRHANCQDALARAEKAEAYLKAEREQLRLTQKWLGEAGSERDTARARCAVLEGLLDRVYSEWWDDKEGVPSDKCMYDIKAALAAAGKVLNEH